MPWSRQSARASAVSSGDRRGHRDFVGVAEALVEHGAEIDPRFLDGAAGPLLEWLELRVPGEL